MYLTLIQTNSPNHKWDKDDLRHFYEHNRVAMSFRSLRIANEMFNDPDNVILKTI